MSKRKLKMDIYADKKINNAVNKLMNKYGWYTNRYMSWDWGHVFWKRYYDEKRDIHYNILECETTLDGIRINTSNYLPQYPTITYQEIRLFKIISEYYIKLYDSQKNTKTDCMLNIKEEDDE